MTDPVACLPHQGELTPISRPGHLVEEPMNKNTSDRCAHVIAPMLAAGEQIELIEAVQIGKVSAKSQIAASAVVGLATAGTVIVALRPQAYFLVLTNQRFVLIDNLRGRVGQVVSAVPRSSVSAGPLRSKGLTLGMDVTIDGTELWFSWGWVQGKMAQPLRPDSRPCRSGASWLAARPPVPAVVLAQFPYRRLGTLLASVKQPPARTARTGSSPAPRRS